MWRWVVYYLYRVICFSLFTLFSRQSIVSCMCVCLPLPLSIRASVYKSVAQFCAANVVKQKNFTIRRNEERKLFFPDRTHFVRVFSLSPPTFCNSTGTVWKDIIAESDCWYSVVYLFCLLIAIFLEFITQNSKLVDKNLFELIVRENIFNWRKQIIEEQLQFQRIINIHVLTKWRLLLQNWA